MANTTHISYKDENKGFWIGEAEMEMIFYFILKTFEKLDPQVSFKSIFQKDMEASASGRTTGYLVLSWDYYLETEENEQEMIDILEETVSDLNVFGTYIPVKALQEAAAFNPEEQYRTPYTKPLETEYVVEVVETLISMLKGEWEHENYNLTFDHYW